LADPGSTWILTLDADVRVQPGLVERLLDHAQRNHLALLSGAAQQRVPSPGLAFVHPALLTTLVYRFGIPGRSTSNPLSVLANGQCFLVKREALAALEPVPGFAAARRSLAEDVYIARLLASGGARVGFVEVRGLLEVEMFASASEAITNWPRSLPLRDGQSTTATTLGLAEVLLVQALPFLLSVLPAPRLIRQLNRLLLMVRIGVLAGTRRAYVEPPLTYWLSPIFDLPAALLIIRSALQRQQRWRGRSYALGPDGLIVEPALEGVPA
jgi:dolichol-phosphate mannosyltransferase